jgi:hypothetical protein
MAESYSDIGMRQFEEEAGESCPDDDRDRQRLRIRIPETARATAAGI